jgi:transcriptional regulator with XRE-family HTH domain
MLTDAMSSILTANVLMLSGMAENTVGDRLRRCRDEAGLSQDALGKAIGVTRSAISQCELGMSNSLTAENLTKAAIRLGKNPLWLATGDGPEDDPGAIGTILEALPEESRTQAVEYIAFLAGKAKAYWGDRASDYDKMMEKIIADMEKRKKAP